MPLTKAVRNQRRANPKFSGAFELWAALSFVTFLFAVEKKSKLALYRAQHEHSHNVRLLRPSLTITRNYIEQTNDR
jgi:hypothetical protein